MARCGCAGQTCSCLIQGGDGIEVAGSGTVNDPYVISTGGIDIGGSIQFVDTDTVDFTVTGQGTEAAPYQISAVATVGVSDLTDVACDNPTDGTTLVWDAGVGAWICGVPALALDDLTDVDAPAPNDNEVLTWNGTSWVPGVVSVEPGQVNTSHGAMGDGTATNPVGVDTPVEWADLSPDLEAVGGQTQDDGLPTYIDTTGAVRVPRGFYAFLGASDEIWDVDQASDLWNSQSSLLLGDRTSETLRGLAIARAMANGRATLSFLHGSQINNYHAARLVAREYASPDDAEPLVEGSALVGVRGNLQMASNVTGPTVYRPIPWAQETGAVEFGTIAAGSSVGKTVTFPNSRFTTTPRIAATVHSSVPHARGCGTANIGTESFMLYAGNSGTQPVTGLLVDWHAVQMQPPALPVTVASPRMDVVPVDPVIATCRTPLCENNGYGIEVSTGWIDEITGEVEHVEEVICGACGLEITDLVEVS